MDAFMYKIVRYEHQQPLCTRVQYVDSRVYGACTGSNYVDIVSRRWYSRSLLTPGYF